MRRAPRFPQLPRKLWAARSSPPASPLGGLAEAVSLAGAIRRKVDHHFHQRPPSSTALTIWSAPVVERLAVQRRRGRGAGAARAGAHTHLRSTASRPRA